MADLNAQFEAAAAAAKKLPSRPSDDDLLKLYALYKQATEGDVQGERPGLFDFVAGAKHDAWSKLEGLSTDEAKKKYVAKVAALQK